MKRIDAGMLGAREACEVAPVEEAIPPGESVEVKRVADPAITHRADAVRRGHTNRHDRHVSRPAPSLARAHAGED
ncbi:hypothetical protein [Methylobacterium longum]|uniref:Uncharacterized protein n=1 Tax=Methylobacterium longum TaxID=767694 RepID=A0ABT8AYY7_9HYPH|nr:hypothetical protein [Methylobacterium longum]MDN3574676.1 hypothetical protein [Methylobacterium longum]